MNQVKLKKNELIEIVSKNRETHILEVKEALDNYKAILTERLEDMLTNLDEGKYVSLKELEDLAEPVQHTKYYYRVLKMLEMSVDDHVILTSTEFQNYVQDIWSWTGNYQFTNSSYSTIVKQKAARV